jgi:small subunit ribosomal protein S8
MPGSKLKESLAAILVEEGYIGGFEVSENPGKPGKTLQITMKYAPDRARTISGIKRVSKPGLRIYARADKIPRVLGGLGVAVVSTSKGLMTDREARKKRMGGEVLCYVW